MNNVPNSDSEQCTESKLSRVHSAPTLGLACAHTVRVLRCVAGLAWPCHRPGLAVSQAWPPVVPLCPRGRWRAVQQAVCWALCRASYCRAPSAPYRGTSCAVSWRLPRSCHACLAIQPNDQAAFLSRYNLLYRDTLLISAQKVLF